MVLADAAAGAELIFGSFEDSSGSVGAAQAVNSSTISTSSDQIRMRNIGLPTLLNVALKFRPIPVACLIHKTYAIGGWEPAAEW